MKSVFDRMEQCARRALDAGPDALAGLQEALTNDDWRVPYAAIGALENRAAAKHARGRIADPGSRPILERATGDPEWCTATEARKASARLDRAGDRPA